MINPLPILVFLIAYLSTTQLCSAQSNKEVVLRYNIGGPGIFGFTPEQASWLSSPNTRTSILNEAVSGTIPGFVIKTHRWAQFSFKITIPVSSPGLYSCSLYWAETSDFFKQKGKRVFNIVLNGRRLNNIDVFAAVGFRKQYVRVIKNVEIRKQLVVSLEKVRGDPYLAGIICKRTALLDTDALPPKFQLNLGGPSIQGFFAEKRKWLSSPAVNTAFTNSKVVGSKPNFFLGTHRWAQFTFSIRIPIQVPGRYDCTCFWAETSPFFKEDGKRVFNIALNGKRINNIDVHKSVGFLKEYKRFIGNIKVGKFLTVRLEKKKGDPFLAGLSCNKV